MKNPFQAMIESQISGMQENVGRALSELQAMEFEGSAGGGAVIARVDGGGELLEVKITPTVMKSDDVELLEDLVCAAVREAFGKASEAKKQKLLNATGLGALGVQLPDIF
jgi:DNA-binding YbaB/EbfC family protein